VRNCLSKRNTDANSSTLFFCLEYSVLAWWKIKPTLHLPLLLAQAPFPSAKFAVLVQRKNPPGAYQLASRAVLRRGSGHVIMVVRVCVDRWCARSLDSFCPLRLKLLRVEFQLSLNYLNKMLYSFCPEFFLPSQQLVGLCPLFRESHFHVRLRP